MKNEAVMTYRVKTYLLWTLFAAFLGIGTWFSIV